MTVKELIKHLEAYPDYLLVVMSVDSEGNNYFPLSNLGQLYYLSDENEYGGIVLDSTELDEYDEDGESVPALVFWP